MYGPHHVLVHSEAAAKMVAEYELGPVNEWEALIHVHPTQNESNRVPEGMSIPANQSLPYECHEEGRGLDCNEVVVTEVHSTGIVWTDQSTSGSADLVECECVRDWLWNDVCLMHPLHLTVLTAYSGLVWIVWAITSSDLIDD